MVRPVGVHFEVFQKFESSDNEVLRRGLVIKSLHLRAVFHNTVRDAGVGTHCKFMYTHI